MIDRVIDIDTDMGLPGGTLVKNPSSHTGDSRDVGLIPR